MEMESYFAMIRGVEMGPYVRVQTRGVRRIVANSLT